jgi:hypothetical protein
MGALKVSWASSPMIAKRTGDFRVKDLHFEISEAVLKAHISDTLRWSISIRATYPEGRILGEQWEPRAYSEDIVPISGKTLHYWSDIMGQTVEWDDCCDPMIGDPIASLRVFEHLDIYKSRLVIGSLIAPNTLAIDWQARCDVFFGDDCGRDLELSIQTAVRFEGIEVPFQEERESRALLRKYIREGEFTLDLDTLRISGEA